MAAATFEKPDLHVLRKRLITTGNSLAGDPNGADLSNAFDRLTNYLGNDPNALVMLRAGSPVSDLIHAARHEDVHLQQANLGNGSTRALDPASPEAQAYVQHPSYETAASALRDISPKYSGDEDIEIPAWIGAGDHEKLGLSQSDAQSLLGTYVDGLIQQYGPDAAAQVFRRSRAVTKDVVKNRVNQDQPTDTN